MPLQELQGLVDADRLGPERLGNLLQAVEAPPTARDHEHYAQPGAEYPPGYRPLDADDVGSLFGAYVLNRLAMTGRNSAWLAQAVQMDAGELEKAIRGRRIPSRQQVKAIAQQLRVPDEELQRAVDSPGACRCEVPDHRHSVGMLQIPMDAPDVPDTWELEVLKKISAMDFGDLDPRRSTHFWYWPREERHEALKHFEAIWTAQQGRKGNGNNGNGNLSS
ncbi:MAG: helix-turn-helix transcriptional regulator [Dehalococcoidales bacterium]|nr:helix-turn-helix transcriptional regulator [Dehalococcoidales bacterium]